MHPNLKSEVHELRAADNSLSYLCNSVPLYQTTDHINLFFESIKRPIIVFRVHIPMVRCFYHISLFVAHPEAKQ